MKAQSARCSSKANPARPTGQPSSNWQTTTTTSRVFSRDSSAPDSSCPAIKNTDLRRRVQIPRAPPRTSFEIRPSRGRGRPRRRIPLRSRGRRLRNFEEEGTEGLGWKVWRGILGCERGGKFAREISIQLNLNLSIMINIAVGSIFKTFSLI